MQQHVFLIMFWHGAFAHFWSTWKVENAIGRCYLRRWFWTFFGSIHPCHRFIDPHSPLYECMGDVTIIMVHRMFTASLDNRICFVSATAYAFRHAAAIGCDLQTWFDNKQLHKMFFYRFISALHSQPTAGVLSEAKLFRRFIEYIIWTAASETTNKRILQALTSEVAQVA